jgi:hypothetical protein
MSVWPVLGASTPTRQNRITLQSGQVYTLPGPAVWSVRTDVNTVVQQYDPITGIWWKIGGGVSAGGSNQYYSDGINTRLANQTGCAVGALLTTAGSGYTSAPTVTASAGSSIWRAVVGGAVSTSVTVTQAGQGYTYPPMVIFDAPPAGGVQATGYCTLSGATVSTVTVVNQGAGYANPPQITFLNDPREVNSSTLSDGYGAAAVATLTGAQTVTAVLCLDHGNGGQTAVPTLAFSGGGGSSAAATAIMCFVITAYAVTSGGTGWTTAPQITAIDAFPSTSPAYTNPATQSGLVATGAANILGAVSAGAITATGQRVFAGGIYTSVPTIIINNTGILITATAALTATVGGATSTAFLQQM